MTYEELNAGIIGIFKDERNKILNRNGRHSSYEKELQDIVNRYANLTGQDTEDLNEATDKHKYYRPGQVI